MAATPKPIELPVDRLLAGGPAVAGGMPEGLDALLLAELARKAGRPILHVARDGQRLATLEDALKFFAPDVHRLGFPAWDSVPYDRVAPNAEIVAERMSTLAELAARREAKEAAPLIVLTTTNAILQRVPPHHYFAGAMLRLAAGNAVSMASLIEALEALGYGRASTVTDPGQYAVRGGILDLFPPGGNPVRFDFFGDTLESIRAFDPETRVAFQAWMQGQAASLRGRGDDLSVAIASLDPFALFEDVRAALDEAARKRFRARYVELFGPATSNDPLYESVSAGRQHQGMEHWLPLFHERLETLFDFLSDAVVTLDALDDDARTKRLEQIRDHYDAREQALERKAFGAPPYNPVPPESLFLTESEWQKSLEGRIRIVLDPFEHPDEARETTVVSFGGRQGRNFAPERQIEGANVFDAVVAHAKRLKTEGKRVLVACWSKGAKERLATVLAEHGIGDTLRVETWQEVLDAPTATTTVAVLPLETGFEGPGIAVIGEQDILGERLIRRPKKRRRSDAFQAELATLQPGDLVVHADHGIGRYDGLETLTVAGAAHDCLRLIYDGGDKLFLPVENIDLLSRYGSEEAAAPLDKLGGPGWQSRKARAKQRIKDIADKLLALAAQRRHAAHGLGGRLIANFNRHECTPMAGELGNAAASATAPRASERAPGPLGAAAAAVGATTGFGPRDRATRPGRRGRQGPLQTGPLPL